MKFLLKRSNIFRAKESCFWRRRFFKWMFARLVFLSAPLRYLKGNKIISLEQFMHSLLSIHHDRVVGSVVGIRGIKDRFAYPKVVKPLAARHTHATERFREVRPDSVPIIFTGHVMRIPIPCMPMQMCCTFLMGKFGTPIYVFYLSYRIPHAARWVA